MNRKRWAWGCAVLISGAIAGGCGSGELPDANRMAFCAVRLADLLDASDRGVSALELGEKIEDCVQSHKQWQKKAAKVPVGSRRLQNLIESLERTHGHLESIRATLAKREEKGVRGNELRLVQELSRGLQFQLHALLEMQS